ncbi:hypothetical protein N658DRAFT_357152 [Parathielavia hyrcaniae]|uniref:Uncharacterized protein n=1 Tax=Parathielavia hyrcaniae TaxID=113614 RepID=A0AAN6Q779_9PEZI|nr:hypothetical protein N658DRAFT_357152 [Parathielavia hyrcaniae]
MGGENLAHCGAGLASFAMCFRWSRWQITFVGLRSHKQRDHVNTKSTTSTSLARLISRSKAKRGNGHPKRASRPDACPSADHPGNNRITIQEHVPVARCFKRSHLVDATGSAGACVGGMSQAGLGGATFREEPAKGHGLRCVWDARFPHRPLSLWYRDSQQTCGR